MDWVKLSTRYYLDPAVASLPDAETELLFVRGLAYCGAEETGGFIPEQIVPSLIRRRRYGAAVETLVARSLWVVASGDRGQPGYRVTRWEDWQEELEALARRRAADRERKRRERAARKNGRVNGQVKGMSRDMSAGQSADCPHPESKSKRQKDNGGTGSQSVRARAREREAVRWLTAEYRLTDDESLAAWAEVQARAREPINTPVPYLQAMAAKGHLADIVAAVMRPPPGHDPPLKAVPAWCGECDEGTRLSGDPDRPRRCPNCHPLRDQEAS